jgi:hypothetical protein
MPKKLNDFWPAYLALVLLVGIRFLPLAVGSTWLWGVVQLTLLPMPFLIGYAVFGVIALVLPLLPNAEARGERLGGQFSQIFYESKSHLWARFGLMAVAGALFALLPMPTHFLGDGYTYLANMASSTGHFVKWSEAGGMWVILGVQSLLGAKSEATARMAFEIVAVISGIVTIWFYFMIAKVVAEDKVGRAVAFLALLLSSSMLLFFGYVESYAIVWGPVAGFIYFSLLYAKEGKGIGPAIICLVIATIFHLQAGMYYPAVGFLLLSRGAGLTMYRRYKNLIWGGVVVIVALVMVLFWREFRANLAFENMFLFGGKPLDEKYWVLSWRHLADMLSVLLLVSPIGLVVKVMVIANRERKIIEPISVYLGLLSVGSMLFLLLIDPGLSMPRDWDLFALCGLAPTVWLLFLMGQATGETLKKLAPGLVVALVIFAVPFLAVNLDRERSLEEVKQIINDNPEKSFGTISILETYYRVRGEKRVLDSLASIRQAQYPEFYTMSQAFYLLHSGKLREAEQLFNTLKPNRFLKDYHAFLAEAALRKGWTDSAVVHAEACIQLQPYYDRSYMTIGSAYLQSRQPEKALEILRRGYNLNRQNVPVIVGVGAAHLALGNFDSTLVYCRLALAQVSDAPEAFYIMAQAYVGLGNQAEAMRNARKYLEVGVGTEGYQMYSKVLFELLPELRAEQGSGGGAIAPH